jgi:hypothetical protein
MGRLLSMKRGVPGAESQRKDTADALSRQQENRGRKSGDRGWGGNAGGAGDIARGRSATEGETRAVI